MSSNKRRRKQEGEYRSAGEPYTGDSPGVECFIEWLLVYCLDTSTDEARSSWRRLIRRRPERAAVELSCITAVAEDPPPDLLPLMQQYGAVHLYPLRKKARVPGTRADYVEWLRQRVHEFTEIAQAEGLKASGADELRED